MLEAQIIGVIPEDNSVKEALTKRDAVVHTSPRSNAAKKYHEIAAKILGPSAERQLKHLNRGWLSRLFGG